MSVQAPIKQTAGPRGPRKAPVTPALSEAALWVLERKFIEYLETGDAPAGLFAKDVFLDFTPPLWRVQGNGLEAALALRRAGHPSPGRVPRWRTDRTDRGFVIEFEEIWIDAGQRWYCREMARADVINGSIAALSVYCTGDWDAARQAQHTRNAGLMRP